MRISPTVPMGANFLWSSASTIQMWEPTGVPILDGESSLLVYSINVLQTVVSAGPHALKRRVFPYHCSRISWVTCSPARKSTSKFTSSGFSVREKDGVEVPELDVRKYDVVNEEVYPKLEDVDAVLLSGSRECCPSFVCGCGRLGRERTRGLM